MNNKTKRAIFLDRDGVINRAIIKGGKPFPPSKLEDVEILKGVATSLEKLREANLKLICTTNQPDVARGTQNKEEVEAIHNFLLDSLCLDEIMVCYHDDRDRCQCRKPLPGMLLDAARRHSINLKESFMVGDRWRDIEAGRNAGCRTILINMPYNLDVDCDWRAGDILEVTDIILNQMGNYTRKEGHN